MSTYTDCMKPYMAGGGPDRKTRFCVGAKLCSGKADNEEAAKELCSRPKHPLLRTDHLAPPKPTRAGKAPARSCTVSMATLAACAISKIDWDVITQETFEEHLTTALQECSCRPKKVAKTSSAPVVRTFPNPSLALLRATSEPVHQHWSKV